MRKWNMFASLSCVLAFASGLAQAQTTYRLTELGTLGGSDSFGADLNESGQVTGVSATASGAQHAFLWNGTTMLDLGTLGGASSYGAAINTNGHVAGNSDTSTGYSRAFVWNGSSILDLGTLGGDESAAQAINDLGQVAGRSTAAVDETDHAFLWDGAFLTDITPALPFSEGRAINSSGVVAGSALDRSFAFVWTEANGLRRITNSSYGESAAINDAGWVTGCAWFGSNEVRRPFVWNGTSLINLSLEGGCGRAIKSSGWVAGNATFNDDEHAFIWNLVSSTDLGTLGGSESSASDINVSGHVVGDSVTADGVTHAFVWDGSVMRDLNDLIAPADPLAQYVTLTGAVRINNQGVILASGVDSRRSGAYRTYLLSSGVTSADADGDGIADAVDTDDGTASNGFDDGEGTSGSITDRAGLEITIEDAASPDDGVRVVVGAGSGQVTLDACGFTETVAANSELIITCGSVTVNVIQGAAQIVLEGRPTVISVGVGATASVSDNGDGTVLVQNVGDAGEVSVTVDGTETRIPPGGSQSYTVVYPFAGFFSPVDNLPTLNAAKAGSAIPVKFSLGGNQGLAIFAAGYPKSQKIGCDSSALVDVVEETVTTGSSSLSYAADQYHYVWKTEKAWFGTCRQLIVKLNDASVHVANFKFK
jgi:probable HAF family extracellular repeat protein